MPIGGFDYRGNGSPDFNLRSHQPLPSVTAGPMPVPPTVGYPGGNVRPPQPSGDPRQRTGPTPSANAYEHANANARFMRTDAAGNQFADNPAGQRPGPNQNAMDNADPRAHFLRQLQSAMVPQDPNEEFRRRQFMQDMLMRVRGGGQGGQMAPPSGGIYGGGTATNWMPPSYNSQPGGTSLYDAQQRIGGLEYPSVSGAPLPISQLIGGATGGGQLSDVYNSLQNVTGGGYQAQPEQPPYPSVYGAPLPVQQPNYDRQTIYDLLSQLQG